MSKPNLRQRTGSLDWNDLRTVLAVARAGSLAGAARELDVRHSTVFRRIEDAERRLGARLFERSRSGWSANVQGESVARAAEQMEAAALSAERTIAGADARLHGVIRVATSELLAGYLVPPLFARFIQEHEGIEIEVGISNRNVDLTRREADLALRATNQPPDRLVGRRIASMQYAVYAAPSLVSARSKAPVLEALPWVGFDDSIAHFQIARWFRQVLPHVRPRLRLDSMSALLKAAAAGAGAVVLPTFAAAQEPALLRITPIIEKPEMELWLLNHPDVRGNARVRALCDFLIDAVPAEIARLNAAGPACKKVAECPTRRRRSRPGKPR